MIHSPFYVVEDFISPLQCEHAVAKLGLKRPSHSEAGEPLKYECNVPLEISGAILSELDSLTPLLEQHFYGELRGEPYLRFQQYWENQKSPAEPHGCESSKFSRKKWVKVKDVDLVGVIWLKDFHDSVPMDTRFEVYGGKLEFPSYDFSLVPTRGTLTVFPATPHFVNAMSHVLVGSLEQIKIGIRLSANGNVWEYDSKKFPGNYKDWFFPDQP